MDDTDLEKRRPPGRLFSCPTHMSADVMSFMNNIQHSLVEKDGQYIVDITVPTSLVEKALNSAAQALLPRAEIPGFRPGSAPLAVVRQHYSAQLKAQVSARLVQEATQDALRELQISAGARPMIMPEFKPAGIRKWIGRFELNGAFKFAVTSSIPPTVGSVDIDGILVTSSAETPSLIIEEQLHHLRHDLAVKQSSDQPSSELDEIICTISTYDDHDQRVRDMCIDSFPFSLDLQKENLLSRTMAEQLLGRIPGDKITFSEDGLHYHISVEAVNKKSLPALDDELAKRCGMESLQALRDSIHEEWFLRNAARIRRDLHMQVREQLVAKNPFDVPCDWVEDYGERIRSLADFPEASLEQEERSSRFVQTYAASDYLLELVEASFPEEVRLSDSDLISYAREELGVSGVKPEDYIKVMLAKGQYDSWVIQQKKTKTLDWLIARSK